MGEDETAVATAAARLAREVVRGQLLADRLTIAPEDTGLLLDTLDNHMATLRTAYGPDVWANDNALIREAYQEAVMTLADHRDPRTLPDLIRSLETCVDDWRALYGVGGYPQAADRLVPLTFETSFSTSSPGPSSAPDGPSAPDGLERSGGFAGVLGVRARVYADTRRVGAAGAQHHIRAAPGLATLAPHGRHSLESGISW
ncbi:hypothetical protein ABZ456_25305 [Streptomyces sp. NPDC005776]|uniref:hypothetical protein n=1 Tax=Streptomyces sp. NPDC005776 TaxID=3154676 RepID=UPI0033CA3306